MRTTNLLTPNESVKAMLHGTIGNEDLQHGRAMQHYCDIFFELAQHCSNIVALKIVVEDRIV